MKESYKSNKVIVIMGPTAVGKTGLSISLSRKRKLEIISADARQVYTEMRIGTARPTEIEMSMVPHHLVGHVSVNTPYTVADFEREALQVTESLFAEGHSAVTLCGGAGLYVEAFCRGLSEMPEIPEGVREELMLELENKGLEPLVRELQEKDPEYHLTADVKNPRRVLRALEVIRGTGKTFSSFRTGSAGVSRTFETVEIAVFREKPDLHERINARVIAMMEEGLLHEAEKLYDKRHLNALQTVGYAELFRYMDGEISLDQAVADIQQNTRKYAKRQMTWFRKNEHAKWFHADDYEGIAGYLDGFLEIN